MSLRYHNSGRSPNYLDAKKVLELLRVRHLELVREEGLEFVDVYKMLTPNDQMMTIELSESLCM